MEGITTELLPFEETMLHYFEKIVATHRGVSTFPHPQAWAGNRQKRGEAAACGTQSKTYEGCSAHGMHQ